MRRMTASILVVSLVFGLFGATGCNWTSSQKGTAIGTAAGAAIGAAIGKKAGNTAMGTILGAAIGGAAGMYIGNYMDKQAAEIEKDIEGAKVERVGEGIKITFDSGILFDVDKAALQPVARTELEKLALILNKYSDTNILIEGHTDATGSEEHNMELSRKRAEAVAAQLAAVQVDPLRFTLIGYGEIQPVATNETEAGRRANRRVELAIMANDKLKKVAEDKTTG
ncbi:MAG: OmpA family protein [Candidatus Krumholzibacteriota bacterium]|nr:OmpA family protein [Candidatus Krumholzibacteriota bacterium]